ncbi:MAG: CDGSH iron-sulfur domain-containing protein [Oligoflexia bacterium]|nr:CDGSH iron-sulfur domain-containing protein [Oligoflexia bacterium]
MSDKVETITVKVEQGKKYHWCKCGKSSNQPFCNGAHKGTGIEPLTFVASATGDVMLCGCKATKSPPFCDGTHIKLRNKP